MKTGTQPNICPWMFIALFTIAKIAFGWKISNGYQRMNKWSMLHAYTHEYINEYSAIQMNEVLMTCCMNEPQKHTKWKKPKANSTFYTFIYIKSSE